MSAESAQKCFDTHDTMTMDLTLHHTTSQCITPHHTASQCIPMHHNAKHCNLRHCMTLLLANVTRASCGGPALFPVTLQHSWFTFLALGCEFLPVFTTEQVCTHTHTHTPTHMHTHAHICFNILATHMIEGQGERKNEGGREGGEGRDEGGREGRMREGERGRER